MLGLEFNGKHTFKDFGLTLAPGGSVGIPSKKKVKIPVAYANHVWDFSEIYGSQVYEERPLIYKINLMKRSILELHTQKTVITNWLMNSQGKQVLRDDKYPGYYFLAEVEDGVQPSLNSTDGILTVNFVAYPFMISNLPEGHDIWDDFNFELDVAQTVDYTVEGKKNITLINAGTPDVSPEIIVDTTMQISLENTTFEIGPGVTRNQEFVLKSGENRLTVTGNGSISFKFYKELI